MADLGANRKWFIDRQLGLAEARRTPQHGLRGYCKSRSLFRPHQIWHSNSATTTRQGPGN